MSRILWVDLETTGLDTSDCRILEVAAIVTDGRLNELGLYQGIIHRPEPELRSMNQWCKETHLKSGLIEEVRYSHKSEGEVEKEFKEFIEQYFGNEKAILAGSSVHFDKKFLDAQMPTVSKKLHYRIIDVSSFKETFRILYNYKQDFSKPAKHRALSDLRGSIEEYRCYLEMIVVPA